MRHVTIGQLIVAPDLHLGGVLWLWGSIPIPIAIIMGPPLLKGQVPLRPVLVCSHLSGLHLMNGVHL